MKTFHGRNTTIETNSELKIERIVINDKVQTPEGIPTKNQFWRKDMEYDSKKQRVKK